MFNANVSRFTFLMALLVAPRMTALAHVSRPLEPTTSHWRPVRIRFPKPVSQQGYVSFMMHTDRTWKDGAQAGLFNQTLVKLPGLARCKLTGGSESINLIFAWDKAHYNRGFLVNLTHLPGPQTCFIQFTWDSGTGRCDGYFNGVPMNLPGTAYRPWTILGHARTVVIGRGPIRVSDVQAHDHYVPPELISGLVPKRFAGHDKALFGYFTPPKPISIAGRRGVLLYSSSLAHSADVKKWILEGPAEMSFSHGAMQLQTRPRGSYSGPGHFVLWCPRTFPNRIVADWQFKPVSKKGLAIIFFAAHAVNGWHMFDPRLPPRNGAFSQYTHGAIASYHFSYFANLPLFQAGRPSSNLRKNNHFYLTAVGPIAVAPGARGFQKLRIIKDGKHIQLLVNGRVALDWTDNNPARFGKAYTSGKIGLRQMAGTIAQYRDFRVWALKAK